ncbi:MAG: hypothetical protein AB4080_21170 [Trichodesmium sp.]
MPAHIAISPENKLEGEVINNLWVIIDLMIGLWEISNTSHLPISPSLHTPLLSIYHFK